MEISSSQLAISLITLSLDVFSITLAFISVLICKRISLNLLQISQSALFCSDKIIISLAPGKTIDYLKGVFKEAKIARAMPNTPSVINRSVTTITFGDGEIKEVVDIFSSIGEYFLVKEDEIDKAIPLHGSMPAYIFEFVKEFTIEAKHFGLDKDEATKLALNAIIGSCELALKSGEELDVLIDSVCSKGGSTIAGLNELRNNGFSEAIKKCYDACVKRSIELKDN